jgi:hypothetical protein
MRTGTPRCTCLARRWDSSARGWLSRAPPVCCIAAAGIRWTLSSELAGYDSINYGLWYDDAQFARVALKHAGAARKLGVKKIVLGECGHAHKALSVIADRILVGDGDIPRESALVLLRLTSKSRSNGRNSWRPSSVCCPPPPSRRSQVGRASACQLAFGPPPYGTTGISIRCASADTRLNRGSSTKVVLSLWHQAHRGMSALARFTASTR